MSIAEKRTQVYFPNDLYRKIVRKAVERYLKEQEDIDWGNAPFFKIIGIADSGKGDLAENHDKYLYGRGKDK